MYEYRFYERKHKRKEQCGSVPGTPEKPSPRIPEIKEVYARRSRMKLEEKVSESCSSENKIDCDKPSDSFFYLIPLPEKDAVFDSCMALSDKEKEQSSSRTESITSGSVGKIDLKMSLDSIGMGDLLSAGEGKEQNFCPGRNFDGIEDLCLESTVSTVTGKQKEDGFDGIEGTVSVHGGSIDLDKSTYTLGNSGGFNHQTDELDSTNLASAGAIDVSNILERDWDSVLSDNHFMELPCLLEPKVSQPYALSQGAAY